jgi:Peptidase family M28
VVWSSASAKTISQKTAYLIREEPVRAILLALFILSASFSIREYDPPAVLSAAVSPELFSADRAVRHLSVIAEKPHPLGSIEHSIVRDYLVRELSNAGLEPQIQQATIVTGKGPPLEISTVENVLARLKGTSSGKAVLLVAHYDSVPNSFGASDDGASVAALLETLRALKSSPPLKNDVVFLFTDAEESRLLGARAFVAEHPWAKDLGVVLNFEARGNSGPVIMFETTDENGWLIKQFAHASPFPVAHSLSYEIYKLLPNQTDFNVFRKAGMVGLNFAQIDGLSHYHTSFDNRQSVDEESLQHHGSYALALTRYFGNLDLGRTKERNAVYFDLFGNLLVHYSSLWVIPLTFFVCTLFVALLVLGLRRLKLTIRGIALGFLSLFVSVLVTSLLSWLLWKAVWLIRGGPPIEATQSRFLMWSFVALTLATTSAVCVLMRNRSTILDLGVGALLWWLILMVVTSIFLPGGSFLFHWPLLFSLIGLAWMIWAPQSKSSLNLLILGLSSVPGIVLVIPIIYQMFVGLTLSWIPLSIALPVLLFGLLMPHLRFIAGPFTWVLPGVSLAAAIVLLVVGGLSNYGNTEQQPSRIYYALNTDTGKAVWASDPASRDERASALYTGSEQKGMLADFAYARTSQEYSLSSAPVASLPAPEMSVLEDKSTDGVRAIRMRISSPRQAGIVFVYLDSKADVLKTLVNNKLIDDESAASSEPKKQWGLRIDGFPQQGLELQLQVRASESLKIRLVDQSYGLPPPLAGTAPQPNSDFTFLAKSFSL